MKAVWPLAPALVLIVPLSMFGLLRIEGIIVILTAGLFIMAGTIYLQDQWAGAMAAYVVFRWLTPPLAYGLEQSILIVFGLGLIAASQRVPESMVNALRWCVTAAAMVQITLSVCQYFRYDPLWLGFRKDPLVVVHGTLGNPMYFGAFVAMAGAVSPIWALPLMFLGVLLSKSATAGLAFSLALVVRWRKHWRYILPVSIGLLAWVMVARTWVTWTWVHRAAIWTAAFWEWVHWPNSLWKWLWNILMGSGPAGWLRAWPRVGRSQSYEIFAQAHNEYVQLIFEGGLVALFILCGWLWHHRSRMASSDWLPAAVALAVIAVGFFPFQVSGTAVLSLMVLGMVTRGADA